MRKFDAKFACGFTVAYNLARSLFMAYTKDFEEQDGKIQSKVGFPILRLRILPLIVVSLQRFVMYACEY